MRRGERDWARLVRQGRNIAIEHYRVRCQPLAARQQYARNAAVFDQDLLHLHAKAKLCALPLGQVLNRPRDLMDAAR